MAAIDERSDAPLRNRFFGNLESLRGIAALSVVLVHCIGCFITINDASGIADDIHAYFSYAVNGRNAVVLFYVLSGFVLSESLARSGLTVRSSLAFLIRRAFRILPLAYVMMAVSAVYLFFVWPQSDLSQFAHQWLLIGYFKPTLGEFVDDVLFQDYRLNAVYWTLYVELIGSLLFVPLFWLTVGVPAWARSSILVALIVVSFIGRETLVPQFFFCFELGVFAYLVRDFVASRRSVAVKIVHAEPVIACLGMFMVAYAHSLIVHPIFDALGFDKGDGIIFNWWQIVIEGFGAAILIFGCSGSSRVVSAILGNRPLRFLGKISFSLYCTHLIILKAVVPVWVAIFGEKLIAIPVLGPLLDIGFVIPAAILLSTFTYSWIELPGIAAGRKVWSGLLRLSPVRAASPAI